MKKGIRVNEIDSKYVGSDCAQVMIPFENAFSMFNETGITFYGRGYKENKIDNSCYIQDERKNQFPYNDIPYHFSRKNLLYKLLYVNQLLDFGKPYIRVSDGYLSQCYVERVNNKTYLIETFFELDDNDISEKKCVNKETIYDYVGELISENDGKKTFVVDKTGKHLDLCYDKNERDKKVNELIETLKEKKLFEEFDGHNIYYQEGEFVQDNFLLPSTGPLYVIKADGNEIKVKFILLSNLDEEFVKVISFDIPVETYDLSQIEEILNNNTDKLKEPSFSKKLRRKK